MRFLRHLLLLGLLIYGAGQVFTGLKVLTYADPDPLPKAAAIVVLSGPWTEPDEPPGETRQRVARGVALWQAGLAPHIVMSGGGSRAVDGPGDAVFMAETARALGVPSEAILIEPASHSTLQNAWLTARLPGVDRAAPILLVTHRYHLPRAVPSFRWAGFEQITPIAADPARFQWVHLLEGVKWPLNIARGAAASIALAQGKAEADVLPWLR